MAYRKTELAEIQLDRAVRLFVDDADYVSAVTLAGAAEEIYGSLLTREGRPNALDDLYESWKGGNLPEITQKAFRQKLNHVKNQLKHAGDPQYDEIEVTQADAMVLIARAAGMHPRFANKPTAELIRFREWWDANAEQLINDLPMLDEPSVEERF